jgi:hypothetical protein
MIGFIKKLTVFVMITAIAMFAVVAMASAGGHHVRNAIQGTYAATGNTQCTMSMGGFNFDQESKNFNIIGKDWSVSTNTILANYTFNHDGTGSLEGTVRMMSLSSSDPNFKPSGSYNESASYHFTYTVTDQGLITFTVVPVTFVVGPNLCLDSMPKHGIISEDRKSIVIECGPPYLLNLVLCNDPKQTPLGPANLCVNSTVLIKVQGEVDLTY